MTTVRLGDQLEARLEEISRLTGRSVSEIIRDAVRQHCETLEVAGLREQLADVIGTASSGGGRSRRTGQAFTQVVAKKHHARRRRSQ